MSTKFPRFPGYEFNPLPKHRSPSYQPNPIATLSVHGALTGRGGDSLLQYKTFSFGENFGVIGWFYPRFVFSLQRRSPAGGRATGEFIADWHVASYGRHSTEQGAHYAVTLFSGTSPLRAIALGFRHVPCGEEYQQIQSAIPDEAGWPDGFPLEFFNLVTGARLDMISPQDSC